MGERDPRVDAYIAKAAPFARPILEHLRALVHEVCPDADETIKWGMPFFVSGGASLCHMAAFKRHAAFGFWRHVDVMGGERPAEGMGSFGKLATLDDLPPKRTLATLLKRAAALNASGTKPPRAAAKKTPAPLPEMPADFAAALQGVPAARRTWDAFSPSHRREYLDWILGAKRAETRAKRIAQAVEWLAEGKSQNWKYEKR
jgi:uncharacterized protein YdeI (YjbR/CyaY-like superfamily)